MTKEEIIEYWIGSSDKDFITMGHLFQSKDYHWALFVGHLVIEKLLKAYYVKELSENPPPTHNLIRLAELSKIDLNEELKTFFATVSTFNIKARYNDYKQKFYKRCTKEFTELWFNNIKKRREWIKKELLIS